MKRQQLYYYFQSLFTQPFLRVTQVGPDTQTERLDALHITQSKQPSQNSHEVLLKIREHTEMSNDDYVAVLQTAVHIQLSKYFQPSSRLAPSSRTWTRILVFSFKIIFWLIYSMVPCSRLSLLTYTMHAMLYTTSEFTALS